MRKATLFSLLLTLSVAVGCGGAEVDQIAQAEENPEATGTAQIATAGSPVTSRPYKFKVPKGYDATKPTPLLVMLHGLSASGELEELILHFGPLAESRNFLYAYPDGTKNPLGIKVTVIEPGGMRTPWHQW